MSEPYDSIIIGAGTAGMTAGVYAARENLHAVLLEKHLPGGQAALTARIENYPGFPEGISGYDLMERMRKHASDFGLEFRNAEVTAIHKHHHLFTVDTTAGELTARSIIISTGVRPRRLGIPGEQEFFGRGVSTCATCDGAFFKGMEVAVIGGGDSAVEEGIFLTRFASMVHVIHRREQFRAISSLTHKASENPRIKFHLNTTVISINGSRTVESLTLKNTIDGKEWTLPVSGVFLYIGLVPNSELFRGFVDLNNQGFIVVDQQLAASLPGTFAAGDVRDTPLRQVITAASDGALAAYSAGRYLENVQ